MPIPNALKFLEGGVDEHPDDFTIDQISDEWSDAQLEATHNYIQWCFPLAEPSNFSASVPILTDHAIRKIKKSVPAQKALKGMMWRMMDFYERTGEWRQVRNHNQLRITRIIRSLGLLVDARHAHMFYHFIMWRAMSEGPCRINPTTLGIWQMTAEASPIPGALTAKGFMEMRTSQEIKRIIEASGTK